MNYELIVSWLESTGLLSEFQWWQGYYQIDRKYGRQICIVPTGGNMPSTVNNLVTASVYFVTASNDSIGDVQDIINDIIELLRCGVYYEGFTIQASSPLPQPVALEDDRLIWELGFRIL